MRTALAAVFLVLTSTSAFAKTYTAERFDSRIEVMAGGSLRVTETIVFRFETGTFTQVFRTVPTRSTDAIEFVGATMDGTPLPEGDGPGAHVVRRRQNGVRIEWVFAPVGPSTHTFSLTYIVSGVARRTDDGDVVAWRALPTEHAYRIESSRVELVSPVAPAAPARLEMRRVEQYDLEELGERTVVQTTTIGQNGWIEVWLQFPAGSIIAQPPAWQQLRERHRTLLKPSAIGAGMVLFAGLVLLIGLKQGYDPPPEDVPTPHTFNTAPDGLSPALAGALAANGRPQLEHAMAALFALAARGVVSIEEEPRGRLSQRRFAITYTGAGHLARHETTMLDAIFGGSPQKGARVDLQKARGRMMRHMTKFQNVVREELGHAGLLDPSRQRVRARYLRVALVLLAAGAVVVLPVIATFDSRGPWPLLVPAAILLLALTSALFSAALTPLSNDGVRRGAHWRAYRKYLRAAPDDAVSADRWSGGRQPLVDLLPVAVALGLATLWSKLFKQRGVPAPSWFQAASSSDANAGFVAFLATGGSGASSGGSAAGGGGGAAGGGASGAS
jgi:hypothetical protein